LSARTELKSSLIKAGRVALGLALVVAALCWQAAPVPAIDFSNKLTSRGIVTCQPGGGKYTSTGAYVLDGIVYVDTYSQVFGRAGRYCKKSLHGQTVILVSAAIEGEPAQRALLGVFDAYGRTRYGTSIDEQVLLWNRQFNDSTALTVMRLMLFAVGVFLLIRLLHELRIRQS